MKDNQKYDCIWSVTTFLWHWESAATQRGFRIHAVLKYRKVVGNHGNLKTLLQVLRQLISNTFCYQLALCPVAESILTLSCSTSSEQTSSHTTLAKPQWGQFGEQTHSCSDLLALHASLTFSLSLSLLHCRPKDHRYKTLKCHITSPRFPSSDMLACKLKSKFKIVKNYQYHFLTRYK